MIIAERYHDISCGHRVVGHENKCRFLHGHNYRFTFTISSSEKDSVGRVLDFSVIKSLLCQWLEDTWDHKTLIWEQDPLLQGLRELSDESICVVSFNPTAENMAEYLVKVVAEQQLIGTGCTLIECKVEETRKCSAIYKL